MNREHLWHGIREKRSPGRLISVVVLLVFVGSCSSIGSLPQRVDHVTAASTAAEQGDYGQVLDSWTRSGTLYNKLDTELLVTATYLSLPFRRAYVEAYSRAYYLSEQQKLQLWDEQLQQGTKFHEFLLAAYLPQTDWSDLANPKSAWRFYLHVEGQAPQTPVDVRRVRKPTPLITTFYPYIQPWEKVYRLRFAAKSPAVAPEEGDNRAGTVVLLITGPRGVMRLQWPLGGDTIPAPRSAASVADSDSIHQGPEQLPPQ
ncbi:MAG: hypothetical protein JRJ12_13780 [Deltaproteobacteria bacterium]|nr:hypothetical protein [Deltaproteobacteria bacterium]MBW2072492.1 hypothetical protein [Deltaproteobacteria bacterium]